MINLKTTLRDRFYGETDIQLDPTTDAWKVYALWLEQLAVERLNAEAISEAHVLREAIYQATDLLDKAVTRPM